MPLPTNPQDEQQDHIRLMRAAIIALAIWLGFYFFYEKPRMEKAQQEQQLQMQQKQKAAVEPPAPAAQATRREVLAGAQRIPIHGDKLSGSIALTGARLDDVALNEHYTTIDNTGHVELLSPSGLKDAYYVESGWTSDDKSLALPGPSTVWALAPGSARALETNGKVTLQWDNGHGLLFERSIALDDHYLFTVTQRVINNTKTPKTFNAWHLISRHSLPADFQGFFILHEGPLGYLNGKVRDPQYKDLAKGDTFELQDAQGWLGITDKYWFVGILPPPQEKFDARIIASRTEGKTVYQTDIVTQAYTAVPGQAVEDRKFVFTGVKKLSLMTAYEEKYGLPHLDLTFDFGMWYFITKPFFYFLHFLMGLTGNVGLAILAMTVVIRALTFPLANKSFRSMAAMKRVAPQLKELQEKYGKDRQKLQQEIFALYSKENVNPFSGCWPLLVQIPVFFALYKVILLSVELRHAPFWGWISDLSAPDPTNLFTLFGLIPWTPPSMLHLGAWPCLFCVTMIIQRRLSPPLPDKTQEQMQTWLPFVFTFMFARFAAGLVIYWTWSNLLGVLQQYYILRATGDKNVSLIRGHGERRRKKTHHEDKK